MGSTILPKTIAQAVDRIDNDPTVHEHLGDVYQKTNRLKLAVAQWERSLQEWKTTIPAEVEPADVAKVQKTRRGEGETRQAGRQRREIGCSARPGAAGSRPNTAWRFCFRRHPQLPHGSAGCYTSPMLASYALQVESSLGRRYPEPPHPYRDEFQRDRDRIIHAHAFRRLENKTQVFTHRLSDHFRTRLTHTIEVAQISRTIAAALNLNESLVETLALAHDLGHPPFGHTGELALDLAMRQYGGSFNHNLHALRIVEHFEQRYASYPGLNLTFEVREGIVKHSRDYSPTDCPELAEYLLDQRPPLEAQLIDHTDEIAYSTADLDDGYEAPCSSSATFAARSQFSSATSGRLSRSSPQSVTSSSSMKR